MMPTVLSLILFLIFLAIGLLHIYWFFGGKWGFEKVLPVKESGELVLKPKRIDSASVGLGLILFALFYLLKTEFVNFSIPNWITYHAGWVIPTIFMLRAIGEFRYVGFFKKIKSTDFGKLDSKYFSPLCLVISLIGLILQFF